MLIFGIDPGFADSPTGVRGLAAAFGLDCIGVQPAASKRALAGKGNADKAAMCAAAYARFGVTLTEHEADAAGHALALGTARIA